MITETHTVLVCGTFPITFFESFLFFFAVFDFQFWLLFIVHTMQCVRTSYVCKCISACAQVICAYCIYHIRMWIVGMPHRFWCVIGVTVLTLQLHHQIIFSNFNWIFFKNPCRPQCVHTESLSFLRFWLSSLNQSRSFGQKFTSTKLLSSFCQRSPESR